MQSSSGLASPHEPATAPRLRRVHYRHPLSSLVYATLENGNGGILRNLSEHGAAIQAVAALRPGQSLRVRFDLFHPKTRIDVQARVSWANSTGQAGILFTEGTPQLRRQLNAWIFHNLLRNLEPAAPMLTSSAATDDLIISTAARQVAISWWPQPVSFHTLARMIDVLVLLSAVLLFFCVFLAIAQTIPPWLATVALVAGVAGFFTALYWWICAWIGCETVGVQLARIALPDSARAVVPREPDARFR